MGCLDDFGYDGIIENNENMRGAYVFVSQNLNVEGNAAPNLEEKYDDNVEEKAAEKLAIIIERLIKKRDSQTPREVAHGNYCKNPCYEFNLNLINVCPKCKGKVVMEYENEYTITKDRDKNGNIIDKKIYNKNACNKFEFNDIVSYEDRSFGALCAYFQLEEKVGDKVNYYMMLEGEKIDLGKSKLLDFLYKQQNKLLPEKNGVELLLGFNSIGKPTILLYNQGGFERMPLVCLYKCSKCGHTYHIMQTSPFMYRDKSKDVVGEKFKA